jgi:hypothetical protein
MAASPAAEHQPVPGSPTHDWLRVRLDEVLSRRAAVGPVVTVVRAGSPPRRHLLRRSRR